MQAPAPWRCRLRAGTAAFSFGLLAACGGGSGGGDSPPTTPAPSRQFTSQAAPGAALAPLTVIGSVPGDGGNNASRALQPAFTFSSLLDATSINADRFTLQATSAGDLRSAATIQVIDRVARLQPRQRLLPQTEYAVRAEIGIQDRAGQTLAAPVQKRFTTADASWKDAVAVSDPDLLVADTPVVAVDPNGNAWVAWLEKAPFENPWLYAKRFDAASGRWSAPMLVWAPATISELQLGVDRAGNAVLVWSGMPFGSRKIWASRYSALRASWEAPYMISDLSSHHHQTMPRLAVRAGGEVTVAWRRQLRGGGDASVNAAATSLEGGGWTAPIRLDDPAAAQAEKVTSLAVALAPEPGRRLAVTWTSEVAGERTVWAGVYHGHSAWPLVPPTRINDPGADHVLDAGVSVDGRGDVFAIWRRQTAGAPGDRLWIAHHDGTGWRGQRLLAGANEFGHGAHIASSTNLGQPTTWVSWFGQGQRVMATQLRAAGPDAPRLIGNLPGAPDASQATRHVVDPAGNLLVVWTTGAATDARVMVARYVARLDAWQTVRQLDQRQLSPPYTTALAVGDAGDALAAWPGQAFDAGGRPAPAPLVVRRFD